MKNLEELTVKDCQDILDVIFIQSAEFSKLILENPGANGIEYKIKNDDIKRILSFSDPEAITWLYKHDIDISTPLKQLKFDFIEMDETNSILFEYVMDVNKIINNQNVKIKDFRDPEISVLIKADALNQINKLRKDLVNKL